MSKILKNGQYTYNQSQFLGQGSFAKVYRGVITKNQRVVAVRILSLKLLKQYGNRIKQIINGQIAVLMELAQLSHPDGIFTTSIYDCFLTQHNVVMILEFCPDGNLQDVVSKQGPLPQNKALQIGYQLAKGLQFISLKKVVHRDIKPDNVFIKKESGHTVYKLGDFGFAVKKQINKDIVGTPIFMSPQLFREQAYGSQVDVWAYGLVLHYLFFKQNYFIAATQQKVKQKVLGSRYTLTPNHLKAISPATADLLQKCLAFQKSKRIKAQELAFHPAFNLIKQKVQNLIRSICKLNTLTESQLRRQTPKGKYFSLIMSFSFLYDLAQTLVKKQNNNLASLYLLKYAYSQIINLKNKILKGQNVINHTQWQIFKQSSQYQNSFLLIDTLTNKIKNAFQGYFTSVMNVYGSQMPQVAQGIASNLGNSPTVAINPQIPIYELKNNWLAKLGSTPQQHYLKISIFVALCLIQKKNIDLDFCALEQSKKSVSINQTVQMIQDALKSSKI